MIKRFCTNVLNYVTFTLVDKRSFLYFFKNDSAVIKLQSIKHLYYACKSAGVEFLYYSKSKNELHFKTKEGIRTYTNDFFLIFIENFCNKTYCMYEDFVKQDFLIVDAGANRGYSALYFASNPLCKAVYSFEPDKTTFSYIKKNISLNPQIGKKISAFDYGLSNVNDVLTFYSHDKTDWINSTDESTLKNYDKKRQSEIKTTQITVKKASEEMGRIIASKQADQQLMLKIDIEGAEYDVLQDLKDANLLQQFSVIFGECHKGFEGIESICGSQFECVFLNECHVSGLYNFLLVNKKQ